MDEIGDEVNDTSGDDKTGEELPELTSESDEPDEFDDDIPETFSEPDEFDDEIPEVFSEPDEFDDEIPEVFSEPDEFDDEIPEVFSEPDEFDDDIPEVFSEPDEFDDEIPETFSEPDEFDDDIPEIFSEPDEFDDDIPEVFSETDEIDDNLDGVIQDKEDSERANEDQDSGHAGNVIENENIGSQSTSTVLTSEIEEIESNMGHQEQEEQIEIIPEEYQEDTESIVNTDESEFIKDVEELAEYARETKAEDENVEPQAEQENAAYFAEQYYETLKEKEVVNDQDSKEGHETEELKQEVTEELNGHQEGGCESDKLEEEEIIEASEEIISTEEFEYLWEIRDKLDQEGKTSEEIEDVMHEAEEMYETLKNAEKIYEELQQENLKRVDHEDEASEEDLKEDLDRVDLIEQAVELEEKLVQQGESQEEIDMRVEESIEASKFEERLETIIEQQEREKLKLIDHEGEATEGDLKEDLDGADLIEQVVELEEKLVQQGEIQEEIDVRVEESIEATKIEERLETIIEQQEREKLKRVDHEDEATEDDLKEELDRIDLVEQAVEIEHDMIQQGEIQEQIDARVEESIEATKLEERSEKIIEQQELEKLKLVNHEDEATEEDLKEELDRIDLVEQAVELEENLVQQGELQEQIDLRVEESIEATKLEERSEKIIEKERNELKSELDAIESEFEDKKDLLEESTKLGSEESDEEETERLQELYRQETGRRPIYAKKKTKDYSQWLEQRELGSEKIKNSKSESEKIKEIKEEDWKTTLNQWIKEASEEECNAELKSELKKALESYNEFEALARKFMELYEKSRHEKLSEKEKNILKSLTGRLQELDPIKLELLTSVFFIKKYITEQYWYDFWNKPLVNRVLSKFFKHISQKYKELRKEQKNEKIKNLIQKIPSSIDENDNISSKNILKKYPQENIHLLESFSSISSEIKTKFKNIKITNYSIIESCDLSQNFRKSGILTKESFEKLQNLLGRSIEHESILGSYRKNKVLNLKHNRKLAEFIGILIAKGHIEKDRIRINLSGVCKNQIFLDYIKELLIEIFLLKEERLFFKFSKDTSYIRINSIIIPHELRKLGVISESSNVPVIPKWIFTRKDFIVSCLKGMFEIAGQIIVTSRGSLEIRFIRPKWIIVECFRDLCFRLGLELSRIYSYQRKMEIYSNNSSISKRFYVSMSKKATLERFINLISTLKWELSKDRIQSILEDRGSSIAEVLEFKFKYYKRDKILRQAPFEYNLDYLCHIPNPIIIQKLAHLFHIIDDHLFSLDMFGKDSLRCSMFRIKGSQKMKLLSSFFKPYEDYLFNGNSVIVDSINGQNLSQMILDAESFYKNKDAVFSISNNIKHYFLQRFVFKFKHRFDSILASELLLWSEVNDNQYDINHITGHVDYLVYDPSCETFYLCDYKPDEISFLPIIPQVAMYGVLFKKLLDFKSINVKCIVFNKKHSWEFDPFIIDSRIPYIVNELKKKGFPIESIWRIIFQ